MIIFYEGVPGSGKSYDSVVKIIANLKRKRKVYTNVEGLDDPKCKEMIKSLTNLDDYEIEQNLHILTPEQTFKFWEFATPGSMVVIDEMQKYFNSRDWQKDENRQCADWCSTHRHEGYDAIFLTQRIEKVDTQVRTLTEWTYRYKKVNFLGGLVNKSYVCFAYSGDDTHTPMTKIVRRYDKKIFACYKSYVTKDTKELGIQKNANILKHPIFFLIPIAIIATIYFAVNSGIANSGIAKTIKQSAFSSKESKKPVPVASKPVPGPGADRAETVPAKQSFNDQYALVGSMADKIVVEDRLNGCQRPLFDVIGGYTILESKRNEFVTVSSIKGEIFTFTMSGRFVPGAGELTARSQAPVPGTNRL